MAALSPTTLESTFVMMLPGPIALTRIWCGAKASDMHLSKRTRAGYI
jgi:hypothetical protein